MILPSEVKIIVSNILTRSRYGLITHWFVEKEVEKAYKRGLKDGQITKNNEFRD